MKTSFAGTLSSLGFALLFCFIDAMAVAQEQNTPQITDDFPPSVDRRTPDRQTSSGSAAVSAIVYNSNGRLLAAACADNAIRVWDARPGERNKGELIAILKGHDAPVLAIAFSGTDTNTIVSAGEDQTVKTWRLSDASIVRSRELKVERGAKAIFKPGGDSVLAMATGRKVSLWDYDKGEIIRDWQPQSAEISAITFSPDGKTLFTGNQSGAFGAWPVDSTLRLREAVSESAVSAVAASGKFVAIGGANGTVRISGEDGTIGLATATTAGPIHALAFSPRGDQLAFVGSDRRIGVVDVATGAVLCWQEGHSRDVNSVAFSPNGQKMASGSADGTVCSWTVPLPPIASADLEKIKAALPSKATVQPKKARRVLVFWRADAILHKSGVPAANHALELIGAKTGAYEADFSRDYGVFDPKILARYDAIVMNSTAHIAMPDSGKTAYLNYVKGGGGVVGIHAAIDMFGSWPEGAAVIGATFGGHPWGPDGTWAVKVEEPGHPLLRVFEGKDFKIRDEFYEMAGPFTRDDRRVLLSVDMSDRTTAGVGGLRRADRDFALSWIRRHGEGRVFYCVFGHIAEPFQNPRVLGYYLDGIQFALGDLEAETSPRVESKRKVK